MKTAVLAYSGGLDTTCITLHGGTHGSPVGPLLWEAS
jgi:argininosuccinate synthase